MQFEGVEWKIDISSTSLLETGGNEWAFNVWYIAVKRRESKSCRPNEIIRAIKNKWCEGKNADRAVWNAS